jgi:spore coat polysaccharide biosynthesis predicted glycosyltransferase SpsG
MYESDFVLTSPGLSSLEALFIGVPTLAVYQNEWQEKAYRTAEFAYPKERIKHVEKKIRDVYDMYTHQNQYNTEIGTGKDEIITTILDKP